MAVVAVAVGPETRYRSVASGLPRMLTEIRQSPVLAHTSRQISSGVSLVTVQPALLDATRLSSARCPLPASKYASGLSGWKQADAVRLWHHSSCLSLPPEEMPIISFNATMDRRGSSKSARRYKVLV